MSDRAWLDRRLVAADAPALLVGDRGFQLGDGLFETLRVRRGVAIEIELHLARLREGMEILAIPMPRSDEELLGAIRAVVAANAPEDAAVRITVSRGAPSVSSPQLSSATHCSTSVASYLIVAYAP